MGYNQIIYDGNPLIDLTQDTVTEETLLSGITAHNAAGDPIVGMMENSGPPDVITAGETPVAGSFNVKEITTTSTTDSGNRITIKKAGTYKIKVFVAVSGPKTGTLYIYRSGTQVSNKSLSAYSGSIQEQTIVNCEADDTITVSAKLSGTMTNAAVYVIGMVACIDWDNGL